MCVYIRWGKSRFTVVSIQTEFIHLLLIIVFFHTNNCKPTFSHPCEYTSPI